MKIKMLIAAAAFVSFNASAAETYVGFGWGASEFDTQTKAVTAKLDTDDDAFKFFVGYEFSENIAVEGFYADLGKGTLTGNAGDTYIRQGRELAILDDGLKLAGEQDTFGAAFIFSTNEYNGWKGFAKLGAHRWSYDQKTFVNGVFDAADTQGNSSGTNLMYGLGGSYAATERVSLRLEYEHFDTNNGGAKTDLISLSVAFGF